MLPTRADEPDACIVSVICLRQAQRRLAKALASHKNNELFVGGKKFAERSISVFNRAATIVMDKNRAASSSATAQVAKGWAKAKPSSPKGAKPSSPKGTKPPTPEDIPLSLKDLLKASSPKGTKPSSPEETPLSLKDLQKNSRSSLSNEDSAKESNGFAYCTKTSFDGPSALNSVVVSSTAPSDSSPMATEHDPENPRHSQLAWLHTQMLSDTMLESHHVCASAMQPAGHIEMGWPRSAKQPDSPTRKRTPTGHNLLNWRPDHYDEAGKPKSEWV